MAATMKSLFFPSSQLIQPKKHFSLSIYPPYPLSSPSKPFLNPNLAAKIRPLRPVSALTEEKEIAAETGDQDDEKAEISSKVDEIKEFSSSERLLNAAIVLGAGTLAITKLLTIDQDYWHGWTFYEVLRYAPEHNWIAYEEALKTHPVLSKMAISGVVYSVGDWIAQGSPCSSLTEHVRLGPASLDSHSTDHFPITTTNSVSLYFPSRIGG